MQDGLLGKMAAGVIHMSSTEVGKVVNRLYR